MFVWSFKEIIALLLCQSVAITVLLIIIHELFVYIYTEQQIYSSSHVAQITDFLEFLCEYYKEKSETCTKF